MFTILNLYLIAFEYALIAKDLFKKEENIELLFDKKVQYNLAR